MSEQKFSDLILIRHGQSQWNHENRFTGWVDVPLTEKGKQEAKKAGELLKGKIPKIDIAFTSDLIRAQKTLEIILDELKEKPPILESEKLNERHYGDLQGLNKKETAEKHSEEQVNIWRRSYDIPPPGGESLKTCSERVLPYFKKVIIPQIEQNQTVLVVAHGNSLRALIMDLEKLSGEEIIKKELGTGVPYLYQVQCHGGELKILKKEVLEL